MNNSRRRFLIRSFAVATVAVTGRLFWIQNEEYVPEILQEDDNWLFLDPDDRLVLAMITPVMLHGVSEELLSGEQLVTYLKDLDESITYLPQAHQDELKELLLLLKSLLGRLVIAGVWTTWNNVAPETMDRILIDWRNSYLDLIRLAYKGLKELTFANWYANADSWESIGYPGPPEFNR